MNKAIQSVKGLVRDKVFKISAILFVLLIAALAILKLRPEPLGEYRLTEIVPIGHICHFFALNDNGQAAGYVQRQGKDYAAIWDKSTGVNVLEIPDSFPSLAKDINNSGQVCGEVRDPNDKARAFFRDSNGEIFDIGTLGGRASIVENINEQGIVVGWSGTSTQVVHAFLWTKEQGIRDLDTRGALYSFGHGINDKGQVVGILYTAGRKRHAFLWREETGMVDIHDRLKGTESIAMGITNSGLIYGEYVTANNMIRAFVWDKDRGFRDLKMVNEKDDFSPFVITDSGCGVIKTRQERVKMFGYVFKERKDLSLLLNKILKRQYLYKALPFETNFFIAYDINNSGQIIGSARENGIARWYFMTPIERDD